MAAEHETTRREYEDRAAQMLLVAQSTLEAMARIEGFAGKAAQGALARMQEIARGR